VAEQIAERSFDAIALLDHASSQLTDHKRCLGLDGPELKVCDYHPNTIYLNASKETSYTEGIVIGVARTCCRNTDASRTPRLDQCLLVQGTEPRR
jgi:hypothetical protein